MRTHLPILAGMLIVVVVPVVMAGPIFAQDSTPAASLLPMSCA